MDSDEALLRIQAAFPRIYLACHSRHQNARTTTHRLSQRDATLLAHLSEREAVSQSCLARHVGVAKSTLSEALAALEDCGLIVRRTDGKDARGAMIFRTPSGTRAMSSGSVLETARLRRLLDSLTSEERRRAAEGLELIARAALRVSQGEDRV